ncbi:tyrosine-type recombinase/integrase [Desulfosporosinus sp.]|uniref:tyrosine-type recombinase/integrase n=1 Tax=Desulfosporosinus sp. TaxID=157907 RepID=UPI0025BC70E7|nr:tyrosine-type recombinase/integrase [Desulfosporosinus sp.]MBC2727385.1 tyrosine-type recombinase/integrase [Desulfosporosinus sp.]
MTLGIEQLQVEEFLDQLGIGIDDIIDNLAFLKGERKRVKISLPGETILLKDAVEGYLNDIEKGMSPTTVENRKTELNGLLNCFIQRCKKENVVPMLANVLETDILEYLSKKNFHKQSNEIANTTYNKKLGILKVFFKIMVKRELIEDSPAQDIDRMPESDLPIQFLTKEEQNKIFEISLSKRETALRDFSLIFTAMNAGLRVSEIGKLDLKDFDYKKGVLKIRQSKFNKDREVPITNETKEVLKAYLEKTRGTDIKNLSDGNEPIFLCSKGSNKCERLSREATRKIIKRVFEKAQILEGASHRLRHTYAVNALQAGFDITLVSELLGHAHISTTATYLRLKNEDIRKKMEEQFPLAFLSIRNFEQHLKSLEQRKITNNTIKRLGEFCELV